MFQKNLFLISGCTDCILPSGMCFVYKGNCYLIFCGVSNWFKANKMCKSNKADMVILDKNNSKQALETLSKNILQHHKQCDKHWMGFTWQHTTNGMSMSKPF